MLAGFQLILQLLLTFFWTLWKHVNSELQPSYLLHFLYSCKSNTITTIKLPMIKIWQSQITNVAFDFIRQHVFVSCCKMLASERNSRWSVWTSEFTSCWTQRWAAVKLNLMIVIFLISSTHCCCYVLDRFKDGQKIFLCGCD